MRAGYWLTHLEHDWHSPIWRPILDKLGRSFTLLRYDQRGNGLSDWQVGDFSLKAHIADLEAVIAAAKLDHFVLYATSQGVPIALRYAALHPERVTQLVLHGSFVRGRLVRGDEADREQAEAYLALMRHGWGQAGSQFLQAFASIFAPDTTPEQLRSLVELQKLTTTAEIAVRPREVFDRFDVALILPEVRVPALVAHAIDDGVHPFSQGREMAASVPDAEFLALERGLALG